MTSAPTPNAGPSANETPEQIRAGRLGRRVVLAGFITFVVGFIGWSAFQIMGQAYGFLAEPIEASPTAQNAPAAPTKGAGVSSELRRTCFEGVRQLTMAIDEAFLAATRSGAMDEASAVATFQTKIRVAWEPIEESTTQACTTVPGGQNAIASVHRFRDGQEAFVRRHVFEIGPLRRNLSTYLAH